MNGKGYKHLFIHQVLPPLLERYGINSYIFQLDGTSAHMCNSIQSNLKWNWVLSKLWSKLIWPPSSLNINPLDYYFWTRIKQEAC